MKKHNIIMCLSIGMLACGMIKDTFAMKKTVVKQKVITKEQLIDKLHDPDLKVAKRFALMLLNDAQEGFTTKAENAVSVLRKSIEGSWYYSPEAGGANYVVDVIDTLAREGNKQAQYFIEDEVRNGNKHVLTFLAQNGVDKCYDKSTGIQYKVTKFIESMHKQTVISREDIGMLAGQANAGDINAIKRLVNMYYKLNNQDAGKVLYDIFEKAIKMLSDDASKQSAIKVIMALAVADYNEAVKFLHNKQDVLIAFIQEKIDSMNEISDREFFRLRNSIADEDYEVVGEIARYHFNNLTIANLTALNLYLRNLNLNVRVLDDHECIVELCKNIYNSR